jgi:NAD(P)-dependent dehydrogenase (short-subunit alcohol dehydrogenase family)
MPEKDGISGDEVGTVQADLVAFQSLAKKHKLGQHNHKIYTIAFSSYYVGMIVPGRQALFSSLSLVFASGVSFDDDRIQYSCSYSVARRFELYRIHASTSVGDQLYIEAFRRPGTIQYPAGSISNLVQHLGRPFAGKKAIVSGGSRGLGRILAVTMALLGAEVTVLYANDPTSVSDLLLDISGFEVNIDSVRVDLTCQSEVYEFVRKIDRCDYLFNIASPHIESELFKNFRVSDACNFIDASIRMFSFITMGLSKKISADGIVMFASSEFLDTQPKNFSHYIAAKAAIESLLSSFPVELMRDDIHFLAIRFPRILTDQTNGIRDRAAIISPLTLIPAILEILLTPSAFHNPIRLYGNS